MSSTPPHVLIIGLTGGIASGKSHVRTVLHQLGNNNAITTIDADVLGHAAYSKGSAVVATLVQRFGRGVLADDGETIDRKRLGSVVFGDPVALKDLSAIVWPEIRKMFMKQVQSMPTGSIVVLEAAILLEAGWIDVVDEMWCTLTSPTVALTRIMKRNGLSAIEAQQRIDAQLSNVERQKRTHVHLWNDGSMEDLARVIEMEWQKFTNRHNPPRAEKVLIVDATTNEIVDVRKRSVMRGFNLPHRATYVICMRRSAATINQKVIYVQKRALIKEYYPGAYDPAPGGVVSFEDMEYGTPYETNAQREMEEEMGLKNLDVQFVKDFWIETDTIRCWGRIFVCEIDVEVSELKLQQEEVHSVELWTVDEVLRRRSEQTPDGYRAFEELVKNRAMFQRL